MKKLNTPKAKTIYNLIPVISVFMLALLCVPPEFSKSANTKPDVIKLPVLMYHGFTTGNDISQYVIGAKDFENDIVTLKKNGFSFVDTKDLVNYVYYGKKLPEKPVMITFDDGYMNNYTYVFPIIIKHKIKVVVSPIAYYVEYYSFNDDHNPKYSQLTTREIKIMHESGLVDFQNHSYNMHSLTDRKGSSIKPNEDVADYINEFCADLKKAEDLLVSITGVKPHAYVYPFGICTDDSLLPLKQNGYKITMGCREGYNYISRDKNCLYMLKRFNRTPGKDACQILSEY